MLLIEITNKKILDDFVASNGGDFLQSWAWGEFQAAVGFNIKRWGVVGEDGGLIAVVTLIKKLLPLGYAYWFAPRGPVINFQLTINNYQLITKFLFDELKCKSKTEKVVFIRFEPPVNNQQTGYEEWSEELKRYNIVETIALEPKQTAMLNLTIAEEELFKKMHQKTRYNIRLAEKKGVTVSVASANEFDEWWRILRETGTRDGFRLHDKEYYRQMMLLDNAVLYLAKHEAKVIAGVLITKFGQIVTYVHGASANEGRNLMAPYLLQWRAIQNAQAESYLHYDFYGVDKVKWPGVTRFKDGFGGQNLAYLGTFDLVFNKGYYKIYELLRRFRRMI